MDGTEAKDVLVDVREFCSKHAIDPGPFQDFILEAVLNAYEDGRRHALREVKEVLHALPLKAMWEASPHNVF